MFENIFQALFSYRPVVFQQGDFRFDITTASFVAAGIAALIMGAAIFTYRTVGTNGRPRDRFVLTVLRMAALGLVVFCLFRPTLVVKAQGSPYFLDGTLEGLEEYVADLTIKRVPTQSHWIADEKPEILNAHIRKFLGA